MFKTSFALALLGAMASAQGNSDGNSNIDVEFLNWAASHNKHYDNAASMAAHKAAFVANRGEVARLNANKNSKAQFELNYMADYTDIEMDKMLGVVYFDDDNDRRMLRDLPSQGGISLTSGGRNWATSHLTPVKNQGQCGSCVAFATTTVLEGAIAIKNSSTPQRLSEQHLVDCATAYGNFGCSGGYPSRYADYVRDLGAVHYENYRAYTASDGVCETPSSYDAKSSGWNWVGKTVSQIADALDQGPLEITIGAGNSAFSSYKSGILSAADGCPESAYDHAVALVGYGTKTETHTTGGSEVTTCRSASRSERRAKQCSDGSDYIGRKCCTTEFTDGETVTEEVVDYWIVQNSWGTWWGDQGFIKFDATEGNGICGMNNWVQSIRA